MKSQPTSLPDVKLFELEVFGDHRGMFMETFRRDRYREHGIELEFVQDNFSTSGRGTLRGLHYQLGAPQGKLVHVTRGQIFDVAVDVRAGSPTFGKWFGTMLSAENRRQIWLPPGFAHGFLVMSDQADVAYKGTATYSPSEEVAIRWDDPEIAIPWPLEAPPILSKRDTAAPGLREVTLPKFLP